MILPAAAGDGVFLKSPPAGRRLARVKNLRRRSANRFNELRSQSCNAGKPLNKIQRDALGAQNGSGRAGDFQQRRAGYDPPAIANATLNPNFGGTSFTSP